MELAVYHVDGSETGRTVVLDVGVFGAEPNDHVLWLDIRRTQATSRQGTHKTKERSEITGSTRKLYRQKGTGMARSGNIKSPIKRSGGRAFGPRPRSYGLRLSRKTRRLARRSALSYKAGEEAIRVVEPFVFAEPDTALLVNLMEALALTEKRVLVVTAAHAPNVYRSSRNLAKIAVREARCVSAEDILRAGVLVCEEGAVDVLAHTLGSAAKETVAEEAHA